MKKKRGVKLIIGLNILGGIVTLIVGSLMIYSTYVLSGFQNPVALLTVIPILCLVIIYFIGAYGLWTFKKWGPNFTKWFYILGSFVSVYIIAKPFITGSTIEISDIYENLIGILICLSIAKYLSLNSVKEMYK